MLTWRYVTPPGPPDSKPPRRREHRDFAGRDTTRPGPHVDLDATDDDFAPAPTPVDALTDAALDVGDAARTLAAHAISRAESERMRARLADLETWRKDTDAWRLKLTGVADTNGRMGRLDDTVSKLRDDVGPTDERRKEREAVIGLRSDRKRVIAALGLAATLAGGGIYAIRDGYDAAAEARGADAEWRRGIEADIHILFGLFGRTPDPRSTP